jgi:tRNA (mo5U34)-methyltransferase
VTDLEDLKRRIAEHEWYHTIEIAPGVVTPGWFDLRALAAEFPWPTLTGLRCLDVGTFDGFWALQMEGRGASEVVAIDVLDPAQWDWPVGSSSSVRDAINRRKARGAGYELVTSLLGSSVKRRELSVYDLDPANVGMFDFVYFGSLLLHLRDPVRALERVRAVCAGSIMVVDAIDLPLSLLVPRRPVASLDGRGRPWWWKPNVAGLVRMVEAAGFVITGRPRRVFMKPGAGQPIPPIRPGALASKAGRENAVLRLRGDPHAVVTARPRPFDAPE